MFLTFLNFPGLFTCLDIWTYPVEKSKQILLPIRPYFNVCQKRQNRFRDVVKKFRKITQFLASEIVLLCREIQKGQKQWRPDLFLNGY